MSSDLATSVSTGIGSSFDRSQSQSPGRDQGGSSWQHPTNILDNGQSLSAPVTNLRYRQSHQNAFPARRYRADTANYTHHQQVDVSSGTGLLEVPPFENRYNATSPGGSNTSDTTTATRSSKRRHFNVELPDLFYAHDPVKYETYKDDCSHAYADFYGFIRNSLKKHEKRGNLKRERISNNQYQAALRRYKAPDRPITLEEKHRAQWKAVRHELFGTPLDTPIPECGIHKPCKSKRTSREKEEFSRNVVEDETQMHPGSSWHADIGPQHVKADIMGTGMLYPQWLVLTDEEHLDAYGMHQATHGAPSIGNMLTVTEPPRDSSSIPLQPDQASLNVVLTHEICTGKYSHQLSVIEQAIRCSHLMHIPEELQTAFQQLGTSIDRIFRYVVEVQPSMPAEHPIQLNPNQLEKDLRTPPFSELSLNVGPQDAFDDATFQGSSFNASRTSNIYQTHNQSFLP